MIHQIRTTSILTAGALALTLAGSPVAFSADKSAAAHVNAEKKVEKTKQDKTAEKRKKIIKEATFALRETQNALKALEEKKNKEALAALERATGKLEIILAREPDLALAPFDVHVVTYDLFADIDAVKKLRDEAEDALEDGRVQEARRLIRNLASEMVVKVTHIPLETYPNAIKEAAKLIDEGKAEDARKVLQTTLNTLVVIDNVIPLPVITAEHLLKEAESLVEKENRSEKENKLLADLLKRTRTKLEFAQALGYGSKKDFKNLYAEIDQIEDKTEEGKSGSGFFDKIKGFLRGMAQSDQPESSGQKK